MYSALAHLGEDLFWVLELFASFFLGEFFAHLGHEIILLSRPSIDLLHIRASTFPEARPKIAVLVGPGLPIKKNFGSGLRSTSTHASEFRRKASAASCFEVHI